MTLEQNTNAHIGSIGEDFFSESIKQNKIVLNKIKNFFSLENFTGTELVGQQGRKSDVNLFYGDKIVEASVKSYKPDAGFNQLTRASVSKFCNHFNAPQEIKTRLENIVVKKSREPNNFLFPKNEEPYWFNFFNSILKDMLSWAFSSKSSYEILVLFDYQNYFFRIYPTRNILAYIEKQPFKFTKGGFNIGNCVSFQRKGGNGALSRDIPKTDIKHPGNNIQIKLNIRNFIQEQKINLLAEYNA